MGLCDEIPGSLPPSGPAGGDLTGDYPNPQIDGLKAIGEILGDANAKQLLLAALQTLIPAPPTLPTSLPPSGLAGGDLAGTYPAPSVNVLNVVDAIAKSPSAQAALAAGLCEALNCCIQNAVSSLVTNPAQVAAVFNRCSGAVHQPNDAIPTCDEMTAAITAAIGNVPADKFLNIVDYDPSTHTITFTVANNGPTFTVNLSDLLPVVVGTALGLSGNGTVANPLAVQLAPGGGLSVDATGLSFSPGASTPPTLNTDTSIPTSYYGSDSAYLGAPAGWVLIGTMKFPYWN